MITGQEVNIDRDPEKESTWNAGKELECGKLCRDA